MSTWGRSWLGGDLETMNSSSENLKSLFAGGCCGAWVGWGTLNSLVCLTCMQGSFLDMMHVVCMGHAAAHTLCLGSGC
jgi:hypothetical protein